MQTLDPQEQMDIRSAIRIALQVVKDRMFTIRNYDGERFTEEKYQELFDRWENIIKKIDRNEKEGKE